MYNKKLLATVFQRRGISNTSIPSWNNETNVVRKNKAEHKSNCFSKIFQKYIQKLRNFPCHFPSMGTEIFFFFFGEKRNLVFEQSHPFDYQWMFHMNHQSSSRLARWKHMTVQTNMKNDVNSMNIAPVSIICACLRMMGMARLPTADAPVKNLAASIQLYDTK